MNEKTKRVLDQIIEKITADEASVDLPAMLTRKVFMPPDSVPCFKWSPTNRFFVFLSGAFDARGIRQWNETGRKVKKGSHAIYILVPMIYDRKKKKTEEDEGDDKREKLSDDTENLFFKPCPVFRYEDTEGAELDYIGEIRNSVSVPDLPLIGIAEKLGVSVSIEPTIGGHVGYYHHGSKKIALCNDSERTFLHELSHAVDHRLHDDEGKKFDWKQEPVNEVVAELSACFLAYLYGKRVDLAATRKFILHYEDEAKKRTRLLLISKSLERVEKIYRFIEGMKDQV